MQGSQDIAVHVGTLHFTCKAVIEAFAGDINPGRRLRRQRPLRRRHTLQRRADRAADLLRGRDHRLRRSRTVTGPTSAAASRARSTSTRRSTSPRGSACRPSASGTVAAISSDVVRLIISNTRVPSDAEGDLHAQASATRVAELEILRLVDKYGIETDPDRVPGGAGLRRAPHPPAGRRAARRRLGDRGLHRLRPVDGRGTHPGQGQDDDRGRPALVRPDRLSPGDRQLHQRGLRRPPSRASSPGRRPSSRTCRSTRASTARSRSTSGRSGRSSTRRGRSQSPASAPARTRRS